MCARHGKDLRQRRTGNGVARWTWLASALTVLLVLRCPSASADNTPGPQKAAEVSQQGGPEQASNESPVLRMAPLDPLRVPPTLRSWIPWVLDELGERACPVVNNQAVCAWPGRLTLDLDESGGRFRLTVVADRETFVTLPGSRTRWPLDVRTQNGPAVVLDRNEKPTLRLGPGGHEIEGRFQWVRLPETLTIPERLALVDLRLNHNLVEQPTRDEGLLWLAKAPRQADDQERLELEVFRRIEDGVPLLVTTHLRLTVSGRAREVSLKRLWLSGAIPLGVAAELPVRVDGDGSVATQVFAGKHEITLYEAHPDNQTDLSSPGLGPPWPEAETWSLLPNDPLRQLRLVGAPASDPARANVPVDWSGLAAYRVTPNTKVSLVTERRGDPNPAPNRISLERDLWLDLDGEGYTVRDHISGKLSQSWRLDLLAGELGQARLNDQPQLITQHPGRSTPGVELRDSEVQLTADWRLESQSRELPAVGWSENADSLVTRLHLPPGWSLLGASGVDLLQNTWLSSWDLLALFFVLIVAFAAARLTHPVVGALAMLTLVLLHNQDGAPRGLWLLVLGAIALLRVVPAGKTRRLLRWAGWLCGAALVFVVVSFSVEQVRTALFPQTQKEGQTLNAATEEVEQSRGVPPTPDAYLEEDAPRAGSASGTASTIAAKQPTKAPQLGSNAPQQDPKAVIQTGPGIPDWHWETWVLNWSGPVHQDHRFRLYLLSPVINGLLSLIRVSLTGLLAYLLIQLLIAQAGRPPAPARARKVGSSAAIALLLVAFYPSNARADFPSQDLLNELRSRVVAPASCEPDCVTVQRARLEMSETGLLLQTEVHVEALSSTRLAGPDKDWLPADVRVDGQPAAGMTRGSDGFLYLRLQPGIHRVEMSGPVSRDDITLNLGTPPHYVEVDAPGWDVSGINELGQVDTALSLHRKLQSETLGHPSSSGTLSGWLRVHRTLSFGKTWSVSTTVERVGDDEWKADGAVSTRIPLLEGERVTTATVPVDKQAVVLTLERGVNAYEFQSTLEQRDTISLIAASNPKLSEQRFNEEWTVDCSPIWHCELDGLAPLSRQTDGQWRPTFVPWPGERVDIRLSRPEPSQGVSTTVDSAELTLTPGVRLLKAQLAARVRTTSQHGLTLKLPDKIELSEVSIDGVGQALQLENSTVTLQLAPGQHNVELAWQEEGGMRSFFRPNIVSLDQQVANAKVRIQLPADRWLLFAGGGAWGPAVLFWGYLALIVLLAPILARIPHSPLTTRQWVILGLGFTQVPVLVAGLVVGWFFLFAYVGKLRPSGAWGHNVFQLGLVFATGIFITCLFGAVYDGLLSTPEMKVLGAGSNSYELVWYSDRTDGALPRPWVLTTSLWVWRLAMLAWAMWLASCLLTWLRWGWDLFSNSGIWRAFPPTPKGSPPQQPEPSWEEAAPTTWPGVRAPAPIAPRPDTDSAAPVERRSLSMPPMSDSDRQTADSDLNEEGPDADANDPLDLELAPLSVADSETERPSHSRVTPTPPARSQRPSPLQPNSTAQTNTPKDDSPKDDSPKDDSPKDDSPKDDSPKDDSPKQ